MGHSEWRWSLVALPNVADGMTVSMALTAVGHSGQPVGHSKSTTHQPSSSPLQAGSSGGSFYSQILSSLQGEIRRVSLASICREGH